VADIFISYSKQDQADARLLAAYLESEGWSVWWDTNLVVGDAYRDEIMKQLAAARAVIVLWTMNSIKSDFVRAEAGRAKADGKLIPVKKRDVAYADIPLPFGEMHTEDLANTQLVRAAAVAQLAKPQVEPTSFWIASKVLRYQSLTWFGIVVGAIELFVHLKEVIELSHWANWVVTNWKWLTSAFWEYLVGLIGWRISPVVASLLTFFVSTLSIAIGARMRASPSDVTLATWPQPSARSKRWSRWVMVFLAGMYVYLSYLIHLDVQRGQPTLSHTVLAQVCWHSLFLCAGIYIYALHRARPTTPRAAALVFMIFSSGILGILVSPAIDAFGDGPPLIFDTTERMVLGTLLFGATFVAVATMTFIAPVRALNRKLSFLAIGVVILVALNSLSVYGPYIRTLLKPPV
jgi:TIR domain